MIKVWILTVVFSFNGLTSQQYEYQSKASCEVWANYWKNANISDGIIKTRVITCTQVEKSK